MSEAGHVGHMSDLCQVRAYRYDLPLSLGRATRRLEISCVLAGVYESGGSFKDQHCWYSFRAHPFRGEFPHVSHAARVRITRATSKAGFGPRSATRPGSSKYKPMNSDNCKKDFAMEMARRPRRSTLSLRLPRWSQLSSGVTRQRKTNPSRLMLR